MGVVPKPNLNPEAMPWARWVEDLVKDSSKTAARAVRLNATTEAKVDSAGQSSAVIELEHQQQKAALIPAKPANIEVATSAYWTASGQPQGRIFVRWDEVGFSEDLYPVVSAQYQVWVSKGSEPPVPTVSTPGVPEAAVSTLDIGTTYGVSVRARTDTGVWGLLSEPVEAIIPATPDALAPPSAPVLLSQSGAISVRWDGLLANGDAAPPQTAYAQALMSNTSLGTYTPVGQPLNSETSAVILGEPLGFTRWFKLVLVDKAAQVGSSSASQSVEVIGVGLGDVDADIQNAIQGAIDTATAAQTAAGDASAAALAASNAALAASNLAGSKGKVLIQSSAPGVADRNAQTLWIDTTGGLNTPKKWTTGTTWVAVTDKAATDAASAAVTAQTAANNAATAAANAQTTANSALTAGQNAQTTADGKNTIYTSTTIPVPGAGLSLKPGDLWWVTSTAGKLSGVKIYNGSAWVDYKLLANSILVPGSVGSITLEDGSIQTPHLGARVVEAGNIVADSITLVELNSSVGQGLDISSNDSVNIIVGHLGDLETAIDATDGNLESMQTYYRFGPDGAVISTPSSPFAVAIRNNQIEMLENGNVVSYWNSGVMYVDQFVGEKVILGNHQLEKYTTGTVVRAL